MNTQTLIKEFKKYVPKKFNGLLLEAINDAIKHHEGQLRYSGEPYINHSIRVGITLGQMGMDSTTMVAGLLHNSISKSPEKEKQIREEIIEKYGINVLTLIQEYSDISKATSSTDTEYEIITKYILNSSHDLRPVLIKLADTLDNVRTIEYMPKDRLNSKLQKILNVYAPLAEYLNLDNLKKELEETALRLYRPEAYEMIKRKMEESNFTEEVRYKYQEYLKKLLKEIQPEPGIVGRVKGIYSIYNKQKKQLKEQGFVDISSLRDLIAFRIVTDSADNCFEILEKIMDHGEILTKEFDDYITHPKPNGYKALQGPIVLPEVSPNVIEIQILAHDMHYHNTYGPASHIAYKESKSMYASPTDKYHWVEEVHKGINKHISLREKNLSNPINVEIFPFDTFAFTPKGKIIQLERGDTIVDFAYKVHTDIGNSMVSAKVNGKAEKLGYIVETGDTIEIKTQIGKKSVKPDWLKYANSASTQYKIQKAWKKS